MDCWLIHDVIGARWGWRHHRIDISRHHIRFLSSFTDVFSHIKKPKWVKNMMVCAWYFHIFPYMFPHFPISIKDFLVFPWFSHRFYQGSDPSTASGPAPTFHPSPMMSAAGGCTAPRPGTARHGGNGKCRVFAPHEYKSYRLLTSC